MPATPPQRQRFATLRTQPWAGAWRRCFSVTERIGYASSSRLASRVLKKMALLPSVRYQSRTMKRKVLVLLALTVCAWSPVFGAPDTPETRRKEAERYLQVSPPKALFEDMADKMAANLPADQRDQFKKLMTTQVDIAALSKAMTDAMVKNFTTEELKALADFYGSPVGKSAMQKFGAYMADIMPVVQAEIMKAAAKMNH